MKKWLFIRGSLNVALLVGIVVYIYSLNQGVIWIDAFGDCVLGVLLIWVGLICTAVNIVYSIIKLIKQKEVPESKIVFEDGTEER